MRSVLRAYALETRDPAEVLARLDRKMLHFEPNAMATVLYAVIEPALDRMHVASAGHFPPVLAAPGQAAELADVPAGMLIGILPEAQRPVSTVKIPPGALHQAIGKETQQRPGEVIDDGLARLCRALVAELPDMACSAVMGALVGNEPPRDDIALLMIRTPAAGG